MIEKEYEGTGQIAQSICVENYLGLNTLSGEELGERFRQHVLSEDVPIIEDEVTEIVHKDTWRIILASGKSIETQTLVYDSRSRSKGNWKISGEKEYQGKGVSYCAYCDRLFV